MEIKWDSISFEELEAVVYRLGIQIIRRALERILEDLDKYLAVARDRNRYKAEEIEERVLDTLFGPT